MSIARKESDNDNDDANDTKSTMTRRKPQLCEECHEKPSLYQCPGCSIRTCSLHCCKAHKKRTKCSGKRSRGAYLPLCRMNDGTLRSDYFFMEEILDILPRARKVSKLAEDGKISPKNSIDENRSGHTRSIASINKKARRLAQQALRRGITLQVMPPILERHKHNSSWYCSSRDLITWKIEVILVSIKKTISFNLSEQQDNIIDHISKHLEEKYDNNSNMQMLPSLDSYQLLIKRLPTSANNPRYIRLKRNDCLKSVLNGLTIIEYPTIYCVNNENMESFPVGTNEVTEQPTALPVSNES